MDSEDCEVVKVQLPSLEETQIWDEPDNVVCISINHSGAM